MGLCGISRRGSVRKVGVLEMYKKRQHQAETQWCVWHSDTNAHTLTCALGVYLFLSRQLHTEVIISSCCMLVDPTHQCSKAWAACLSHSKGFFFKCVLKWMLAYMCLCMCACLSSSPVEVCTSLHAASPLLWPSLEVARLKQRSCLQGNHWVTAQAAGHEADVHPARTQTEAHQQKLPHMGRKTKRHTATYADPLHPLFLSPPRMHEEMGSETERGEAALIFALSFQKTCFRGEIWRWIINIFIQFWCLSLAGKLEVPEWGGPA